MPKKQTKFQINSSNTSYFDFIWAISSVLFSNKDLQIITWWPENRRNYLDSILVRIDKSYAYDLKSYKQSIKQRNSLLKQIKNNETNISQLDVWDTLISQKAQPIIKKRAVLIKQINSILENIYFKISKSKDKIYIHEKNTDLKDLLNFRERDLILGSTSIWPHRNDFFITLNDININDYWSQWEIRSTILSLKFTEINIIEKAINQPSILLLDDVFSELDEDRQQSLVEILDSRQTFITTTHLDNNLNKHGNIMYVKNGEILNS